MYTKRSIRLVQTMSVISMLYMLTLNALSTTVPLNGRNFMQIAAHYPHLFLPHGTTNMVWSVIDLLLIIYTIRVQMRLHLLKPEYQPFLVRQGWLFTLINILNGSWILIWHLEDIRLSMGIMFMHLVLLTMLYLDIPLDLPMRKRWLKRMPFSIYLAWIVVCCINNAASLLVSAGWKVDSPVAPYWTLLMFATIVFIGWFVLIRRRDIAFSITLIWALCGILYRHVIILEQAYPLIIYGLYTAIALLIVGIIHLLLRFFRPVVIEEA